MANTNQDKRNAKGGGTVRQREDGRWEARCTINGKRRSFYADTQKEALKAMRAAQKSEDEGLYIEPSKLTVEQWFNIWLEEYERPQVRYRTYNIHSGHRKRIFSALGTIKLQKLTTTHIQMFLNDMHKEGLASETVNHYKVSLSMALKQATKLRYISTNPAEPCTTPKKESKELHPLSDNEVKKFLNAIEGHRFQALFTVALFTGMRKGEVLGLPWDAVDFKAGTITVKQQLQRYRSDSLITPTKNGKPRTLTPAPFVMDILRNVRQEQFQNRIKLGSAWNNECDLVFTSKTGKYLCSSAVYSAYKKIVESIGRPDVRFHDLRHTYAVMALQEGDSPKTVQDALGHATASFTLEVYAHVSEKMKQESANRMQNYYEKMQA